MMVTGRDAGRAAGITGLGVCLPERVMPNAELESFVETTDEWIRSRTGIAQRHIAAPGQGPAALASVAARAALQDAGVHPEQIQLIILATCTPDHAFPSSACLVQDQLGCTCAAYDLAAACSGWVYALITAQQFVENGMAEHVLVIGAETMSRILDWNDRNTCVLFGDGAGAAVISRVPPEVGLRGFDMGANGAGGELLKVAGGTAPPRRLDDTDDAVNGAGQLTCASPRILQNGREVYRFAVHVMGESAVRALRNSGLEGADVDLFVPHQANIRIIDAAARRLGLPPEKVFTNVHKYGNTSAASIPIALWEAERAGRLHYGDTVVTVGFGGGLTWASSVLLWNRQPGEKGRGKANG